jgi:hypothetical protein
MRGEGVHDPLLRGDLVIMWDPSWEGYVWGFLREDVEKDDVYANVLCPPEIQTGLWDREMVKHAVWSFIGPVHRQP